MSRTIGAALALGIGLVWFAGVWASSGAEARLGEVLARTEPPAGVVFEVVSGDERKLEQVTPAIKDYARRLRARFPDIEVAVVTHGAEQFSLLRSNTAQYAALHRDIAALIREQQVPVHVCANHASWREKSAADFPDHIQVAPSASGQLEHYEQRGFVLIVL